MRTEAAVTADALVTLMVHGLIPRPKRSEATAVLGLVSVAPRAAGSVPASAARPAGRAPTAATSPSPCSDPKEPPMPSQVARLHETSPPADPVERLAHYEAVIDESVAIADVEQRRAWLALEEIHRGELWRASHPSFSAYLEDRWGQGRSSAYRQIAWARTVRERPVPRGTVENRSQREVAGPPRGKAEAIDIPTRPVSPAGRPQPVDLPVERPVQLALFGIVDQLAGHLAEATRASDADRRALAVRLRAMADQIDPPKGATAQQIQELLGVIPENSMGGFMAPPPTQKEQRRSGPLPRRDVTPMFKKGAH